MGEFTIRVKQDIIQERVNAAEIRDIEAVAQQYGLDKGEIHGDGVDLHEAAHLPFDAFMQLSGGDTKITKADIIKFAGTPRPDDIVREYAQNIAASLPAKVLDSANTPDGQNVAGTLAFQVIKRGMEIVVRAERIPLSQNVPPNLGEASAAGVFSIINGKDLNGDGQIAIGGNELRASAFVQTAGDALKLSKGDFLVTPSEALEAIFSRAQRFSPHDIGIEYKP